MPAAEGFWTKMEPGPLRDLSGTRNHACQRLRAFEVEGIGRPSNFCRFSTACANLGVLR